MKTALDAKRSNIFMLDPEKIVIIGWDTKDGPEHPLWDKRAQLPVDEKLVCNIKAVKKIIHPIRVRKNGDGVEAVIGRQRVKACREVNKQLRAEGCEPVFVPAMVDRPEDHEALGMMISENELRQGDFPMERARKAQRYIGLGRSEAETAAMFGVTVTALRQYLSLLDLDKSVQSLVEKGKLSASAAVPLAQLPRSEQKEAAEKLIESGAATTADVRQAVRTRKNRKSGGDGKVAVKAPGKKLLKHIVTVHAANPSNIVSTDFINGILFCMGEIEAEDVRGLATLLKKE